MGWIAEICKSSSCVAGELLKSSFIGFGLIRNCLSALSLSRTPTGDPTLLKASSSCFTDTLVKSRGLHCFVLEFFSPVP